MHFKPIYCVDKPDPLPLVISDERHALVRVIKLKKQGVKGNEQAFSDTKVHI